MPTNHVAETSVIHRRTFPDDLRAQAGGVTDGPLGPSSKAGGNPIPSSGFLTDQDLSCLEFQFLDPHLDFIFGNT